MKRQQLGRTELMVSQLCLGGNVFGWTADEAASFEVLDAYSEAGGNYVDTCPTYSRWAPGNDGGESETIIGTWMKNRGNRSQMVIATKGFGRTGPGPQETGLTRVNLTRSLDGSLRRLRTDYIDMYLSHYDDQRTPQEETMETYDRFVREGKVRYVGVGAGGGYLHNGLPEGPRLQFTALRLLRALWVSDKHGWTSYAMMQPEYNVFTRVMFEPDLEELAQDQELGVITRSSLASGFLTGKYRRGGSELASQRAPEVHELYCNDRGFAILEELDRVASRYNASVAQVALAWIMARSTITAALASASTRSQLIEIVRAANLTLDAESVTALDKVSATPPALSRTRAGAGVPWTSPRAAQPGATT
jgi:aryl-alcohol dehydrogenase-like predicted oxidoreductase